MMKAFNSRSQSGQDQFVYARVVLDAKRRIGSFLDVGCSVPFAGNNTAALEELGWRGLLVDINPTAVEECRRQRLSPAVCADATQADWKRLTQERGLGPAIDYLSLDVDDVPGEPSKVVKALKNLLAVGLTFAVITVEHDRYRLGDAARDELRTILTPAYELAQADVTDQGLEYEDWWVAR
jgi:hypothetical protein